MPKKSLQSEANIEASLPSTRVLQMREGFFVKGLQVNQWIRFRVLLEVFRVQDKACGLTADCRSAVGWLSIPCYSSINKSHIIRPPYSTQIFPHHLCCSNVYFHINIFPSPKPKTIMTYRHPHLRVPAKAPHRIYTFVNASRIQNSKKCPVSVRENVVP